MITRLLPRLQDSEVKSRIRTQEHEELVSQLRLEIHENTAAFKVSNNNFFPILFLLRLRPRLYRTGISLK